MKKILGIGVILVYTAFLSAAQNQEPLTAPQLKRIIESELLSSENEMLTLEFLIMLYHDQVDRALFEAMLDLHAVALLSAEELAEVREDIDQFLADNPATAVQFLERLTNAFNADRDLFVNSVIDLSRAYRNDAMELD